MDDKKNSLLDELVAFLQTTIVLFIVFIVVAAVVAVVWAVVANLAYGLYKLFSKAWRWAESKGKGARMEPPTTTAISQSGETPGKRADSIRFLNEFRVSSPLIKTLIVWFCRIFGFICCLGGIASGIDAINGKAQPDNPGIGGSIVLFLMGTGMTAYGFWRRKKPHRS